MTEEIKEILDRLDFNEWEVDLYKTPITWCELYNIRDCIINLQEENEDFKTIIKQYVDIVLHDRKIIDNYISRIDKANQIIMKQKTKMYKSRNKIAMYILMKLEKVLKGSDEE